MCKQRYFKDFFVEVLQKKVTYESGEVKMMLCPDEAKKAAVESDTTR